MTDFRHLRLDRDQRGVVTVAFDVQGKPLNVFDDDVIRELYQAVEQLERDREVRFVLFRSTKESGFFAGADVSRIQQIDRPEEAQEILNIGQQLFDRVEALPMPTLAAIHGPCLGGGLEFALSCRYRVARDDAQTRLGLPEVQLGFVPAWGGTQRLPRVVGTMHAVRMILEGSKLSAAKAAKRGLVDLAPAPENFETELQRFIDDRLAAKPLPQRRRGFVDWLRDGTRFGQSLVLKTARKQIAKRGAHYPALPAALRAIETGLRRGHADGLAVEREEFSRLLFGATCRNLLEVFFQRERARKRSTWVPDDVQPRKLRKIAVLGGGTMGAGIAQALAYNGYEVVLKEINNELARAGRERIESLMNDAVRKGALRAEEAKARLEATTATSDWAPLENADLAIEAVVEREDIKHQVFKELDSRLGPEAILATNTSSLSATRLADSTGRPEKVAGLHFFNPVHKMPLVEVVRTSSSSDETIAALVDVVRRLGKVPIVTADAPGFLVNRILFPYLDEAVRLVCEGYDVKEIDKQALKFGMPMGPLELMDQVGIDVGADIANTLVSLRSEPSPTADRLKAMADRGWRGKKSGQGFYQYSKGKKQGPSRWEEPSTASPESLHASGEVVATDITRSPEVYKPDPSHPGQLSLVQQRLIYPMVNEAARCLEQDIVAAPWIVDLGMVMGTGFAPFRGGPLRIVDAWSARRVAADLESLSKQHGPRFEPAESLREMADHNRGFYDQSKHPRHAAAEQTAGAASS